MADGPATRIHQEDSANPRRGFRAGKEARTSTSEHSGESMKMKRRRNHKVTNHDGSTFDSFLEEQGIREEVQAVAIKRVLAGQLERAMQEQQKTKQSMAKQLRTSRSQLDRLLDPQNTSVTLDTIARAAGALGKRVIIRVADLKTKRA